MLSQLADQGFDKAYMDRNVEVHAKDVQHFQEHAASDEDPGVRAFAAANLPVLSGIGPANR